MKHAGPRDRQTWNEKKREQIAELEYVDTVKLEDGERDFIAGQRDIDRVTWRVTLNDELAEQVEFEQDVEPDLGFSETLTEVRNTLELQLGLSPADDWTRFDGLDDAQLFVTGSHDRRPGGSL